jgi:flagellar basal-body rod protein FlgB
VESKDGRSLLLEREIRPVLFDTTQLALERAIGGAAQRHAALAANLANVNTPGYQRVDVDFQSALRGALAGGPEAVERTTFATQRDATAVTRADGNSVDADAESAELAANALEQQAAVSVAHTRIAILRSAMGVS